jgi:hypothetical protein
MRFAFLFACVTSSFICQAQLVEPILFNEKIHDFGTVPEQAGTADFEFSFTNKTTRSIKILSVNASCGCTTPDWSKDAIAPGATGFIKASFDPKGRPGYFNKTLSVTTDWDKTPLILQIKGTVVSGDGGKYTAFPNSSGGLSMKSVSCNMGKLFINRENEAVVYPIKNTSKDTIRFSGVECPKYLKVQIPKQLAPGQAFDVKVQLDTKLKGQYGFLSENFILKTNDPELQEKPVSVYATVEEYFPKLSQQEQAVAPVLSLSANVINFGRVRAGVQLDREVKIRNAGKKDLIIRFLQTNCTCLTAKIDKTVLKPGEETALKTSLNTTGRSGPQNKSISIYSTDPQNSVQRITLTTAVLD